MHDIFVARQPIFNRDLSVFAYELLFRASETNAAGNTEGDGATSTVLVNTVMDIGIENLVGNKPAFINLSRGFLSGEIPIPLSKKQVVLEVLEDIEPNEQILATLRDFAERGYTIALDDFVLRDGYEPLLEVAHMVKLDVRALTRDQLRDHVAVLKMSGNLKLLAEKIETQEELQHCKDLGFDYFQGYFLCRPNVHKGSTESSNRLVIINLLAQLQNPDIEIDELERLIAQDISLTFRLLRYINSPSIGLARPVESLRQALLILGSLTIRNWVSLMLLAQVADKPRELTNIGFIRAKMCEMLAHNKKSQGPSFTVGLFSIMDALFDQPMEQLLEHLPFDDAIKMALLNREGELGQLLQRVITYEESRWEQLGEENAQRLLEVYLNALRWVRESEASLAG